MQAQDESRADFERAKADLADKYEEGKRTATEALHDARDDLTRKASEYAGEAKAAILEQAEGKQRDISANMKALGGALRAASEHLANADQRTASKLVNDAAGGLERLSTSLKDKPLDHVLEEIRTFGRQNSGVLIAGSVLAGLALGRLIKSSAAPGETGRASQFPASAPPADTSVPNGPLRSEASSGSVRYGDAEDPFRTGGPDRTLHRDQPNGALPSDDSDDSWIGTEREPGL